MTLDPGHCTVYKDLKQQLACCMDRQKCLSIMGLPI